MPTGNGVPEGKLLVKLFSAQSVTVGSVQDTIEKHSVALVVLTMFEGHPAMIGGVMSPGFVVQHSGPPVLLTALIILKLPYDALGSNTSEQLTSMLTLKSPLTEMSTELPLNFPLGGPPLIVN